MTRKTDAPGTDAQPWLRVQLAALCSATDGERRAAIARWRSCTDPRAFTLVIDKLIDVIRRGGVKAPFASESLIAFGDLVLFRVLHHLAHSGTPRVRVRLLELLALMAPPTDHSRGFDFETSLLALAHAERDEAVQRAFAPALFQHAPSARYAALRAAEERMQPGAEVS
jgi:hypothetical protein